MAIERAQPPSDVPNGSEKSTPDTTLQKIPSPGLVEVTAIHVTKGEFTTDEQITHVAQFDRFTKLTVASKEPKKVRVELYGDGKKNSLLISPAIARVGAETTPVKPNDQRPDLPSWRRINGVPTVWRESTQTDEISALLASGSVDKTVLPNIKGRPYGMVVEGEPLQPSEIKELGDDAHGKWISAERRAKHDPLAEHTKEELDGRFNEIKIGKESGLWRINFAVGGHPDDIDEIARMAAAAAHIPDATYTFHPDKTHFTSADEAIAAQTEIPPLIGSTKIFAHLVPVPDGDIPGVPVIKQPEFSTNILGADKIPEKNRVVAGVVLDNYNNPGVPFVQDRDNGVAHKAVAGASRSGKTNFNAHDVAETIKSAEKVGEPIGLLLLDPKPGHDYSDIGDRIAKTGRDVAYITIGDKEAPALIMNPCKPLPGETIAERQDKLYAFCTIAHAAAGESDPEMQRFFGQYLGEAIYGYDREGVHFPSIYEQAGFDVQLDESEYPAGDNEWPDINVLIERGTAAARIKGFSGTSEATPELWASYAGKLTQGSAGDFFGSDGTPIDTDKLTKGITIIKLHKVNSPMARSLISMSLLDAVVHNRVQEQLASPPGTPNTLKQSIVVEEIQQMAPKDSPSSDVIDEIYRAAGSAGVGITSTFQEPSKVSGTVLANSSTVVSLKLQEGEDIEKMAAKLGLTEDDARSMTHFPKGIAFYKGPGTGEPVRVQIDAPPAIPDQKVALKGPEAIAATREGQALYSPIEIARGNKFITKTQEGRMLAFTAHIATVATALGFEAPTVRGDSEFFTKIRAMRTTEEGRRQIDYAIQKTVKEAVLTRAPVVLQEIPQETLRDVVTASLTAAVDGHEPSTGDRPSLSSFASIREVKATLHESKAISLQAAINKRHIEGEMAGAAEYLKSGETELLEAAIKIVKEGPDKIEALNQTLEKHPSYTYGEHPEVDGKVIYRVPGNPVDVSLQEASSTHADTAAFLIPDSRPTDRAMTTTVAEVIESGEIHEWEEEFASLLSHLDMPSATRATLVAEHTSVLQRAHNHREGLKEAEAKRVAAAEARATKPVTDRVERVEQTVARMEGSLGTLERVIFDGLQLKPQTNETNGATPEQGNGQA